MAPYIVWDVLHPPAFGLTAEKDSVDYEFADPAYALELARLNGNRESSTQHHVA